LAFVVISVREKDFELTISQIKTIKAALDDLVWWRVKQTVAQYFVISPLSFVNSAAAKFTESCS
jgi:hypothetical protein